jgi:phosphodiesterase/alkaline phosphatase D-like protein
MVMGASIGPASGNHTHSACRAPLNRTVSNRELATLSDYRTRLALYRTDESLAFSHQNFPWIQVWDDHEIADNTWKVYNFSTYSIA